MHAKFIENALHAKFIGNAMHAILEALGSLLCSKMEGGTSFAAARSDVEGTAPDHPSIGQEMDPAFRAPMLLPKDQRHACLAAD